jgi:hypothetical protein
VVWCQTVPRQREQVGRVAAREGTMEEAQKHWWQVKYWWYKIQRLLGRGGF